MGREGSSSSSTGERVSIASRHSNAASIKSSSSNVDARMNNVLTSIQHVTKDIRDLSRVLQSSGSRRIEGDSHVPIPFKEWREASAKVELNVGGSIFRVNWELLLRVPDCRLARLAACQSEEELNNSMFLCCDSIYQGSFTIETYIIHISVYNRKKLFNYF